MNEIEKLEKQIADLQAQLEALKAEQKVERNPPFKGCPPSLSACPNWSPWSN